MRMRRFVPEILFSSCSGQNSEKNRERFENATRTRYELPRLLYNLVFPSELNTVPLRIADVENGIPIVVLKFP